MPSIKKFYVVTKPYPNDVLEDIFFAADWRSIVLHFRGGLSSDDIIGVYADRSEALNVAKSALHRRDVRY